MNAVLSILRMLRLPNLLIVWLSMALPYYLVLRPAILRGGGLPAFDGTAFDWLSLNVVLTTLAGYLVNDFFDAKLDAVNHPRWYVIGRYLRATTVFALYVLLVAGVIVNGFLLELKFFPGRHLGFLWLFAGVSGTLFVYSAALKCAPVLGNLTVAGMCALVPYIVSIPERRPLQLLEYQDPALYQRTMFTFWNFVIFAFVATLFREMVKDVEDHGGDAECGCHTLAVVRGVRVARKWAASVGLLMVVLLTALIFYWQQTDAPAWKVICGAGCLLAPILFATWRTFTGRRREHFSLASFVIKLVLALGMILLAWEN